MPTALLFAWGLIAATSGLALVTALVIDHIR